MCEALKELFADDFKESELKGRNAGRTEGAASKIIEKVIKKHQKGYTAEATADMLEEPVSRIRQIYDVIEKARRIMTQRPYTNSSMKKKNKLLVIVVEFDQ